MTVSSNLVLQGFYNAKQATGAPSINSDATLEIEGHEDLFLNTKQFPWPTVGSAGEIEAPGPLGMNSFEPQQLRIAQQGPITFSETVNGRVMRFMQEVVASGGKFNATAYEGTPDRFVRGYKLVGAFFVPDQPDRDWENRAQIMLFSGTLFYHFFGQTIPGNTTAL